VPGDPLIQDVPRRKSKAGLKEQNDPESEQEQASYQSNTADRDGPADARRVVQG